MGQHIVTNRVVSHILLRAKSNNGPVASLLICWEGYRAHCLRHFFPLCQNDRQDKSNNNNKKRRHVCSTETAFTIIYNSRTVFLTAISNKTIRIWLIIFGDCFRFHDRWRQSVINTWPSAACQSRAKNRLSASPGLPST